MRIAKIMFFLKASCKKGLLPTLIGGNRLVCGLQMLCFSLRLHSKKLLPTNKYREQTLVSIAKVVFWLNTSYEAVLCSQATCKEAEGKSGT